MTNILNTTTLQAISFVLFLAALPLVSFGTMEDQELLWYAGLVLLLIAGILPPLGRFVVQDDDGDEEEAADEADGDQGDRKAADDGDADDADDGDDNDSEGRADAPHSAGPIGRGAGSAGREPDRQRVQEQAEHSSGEDDR